jgi:uncharacterized protein YcbX
MSALLITQLVVYPIKGCRGVSLARSSVTDTGLQHDREFMVVNSAGRFVTQRTHSKLALVAPQLPPDAASGAGSLSVSAPGMPPLHVPLSRSRPRQRCRAAVWEWSGEAEDEGDDAGDWFSSFLGVSGLRLVRFAADARRDTDASYAADSKTLFTDGFPLLTISEASLAALNARLASPVPMDRFRPNLVVGGALPFAEDEWERFKVGTTTLRCVKPCSRCKVTTIDQATGVEGQGPLRSLSSFRSGAALGWKEPGGGDAWRAQVFFGFNAVAEQAGGVLAVGDALQVLSTRDWRTVGA